MTTWFSEWVLTILIFFPLLGALLVYAWPGDRDSVFPRHVALGISFCELLFSLHLVRYFIPDTADFQFAQRLPWIGGQTGIEYIVGIDGVSLSILMLITLISPLVILSTYSSIEHDAKPFLALFLLLESAMIGALVSIDLIMFYMFWEAMLIPMYFMIGVWGGRERVYAATKFFIYTFSGSILLLIAFIYLYYTHASAPGNVPTTNLVDLYETAAKLPLTTQLWLFAAVTLGFAVKVPIVPFHTWLPDAHVQAPTAGSVDLAAVLLKMGTYGLLRFSIPLFPKAAVFFAPLLMTLGVVGIVYGALIAWRQTDAKKLIAYSSVSHMGFVVAGMFALNEHGLNGALLQMINHGVSSGALFLLIGVIYERRHTRLITEFGGLAKVMPLFSIFFVLAVLGSIGLPGTGAFVGEFFILIGLFKAHQVLGITAILGVVLGAVYMLWLLYKVIWGPVEHPENQNLRDLSFREWATLGVFVAFIFIPGFFSGQLFRHAQSTLQQIQQTALTHQPYRARLMTIETMQGHVQPSTERHFAGVPAK